MLPGLVLRGELVYFPSAYPMRAVLKDKQAVPTDFIPTGFADLSAFQDAYADALGLNPWLELFPAVLENLVAVSAGDSWLLRDSSGLALPLSTQFSAPWELFALSGGHPLTVFGVWDGFAFLPLTVWTEGRHVFF